MLTTSAESNAVSTVSHAATSGHLPTAAASTTTPAARSTTATTSKAPSEAPPKRRRQSRNYAGIREAVQAIYREIAIGGDFDDADEFEEHVRPIAAALFDVTGLNVGLAVRGAGWLEADRVLRSRLSACDKLRIESATRQGRERLGVPS